VRTGGQVWPSSDVVRGARVPLGLLYEALEQSGSYADTRYRVTQHADGHWECECPGFEYGARQDGECKHIDRHRALKDRPQVVLAGVA
jgi:hypothetical protein